MNPVILVDELDKVSTSSHGREIIGALMHIIDQTTNANFTGDKYLGLSIDLSKVIFVFTFNDISLVDTILGDRIQKIHVPDYTTDEKVEIVKQKMLKTIFKLSVPIEFTDSSLHHLVSKGDTGLRTVKQYLYTILTRINLILKVKDHTCIKLGYKKFKKTIDDQLDKNKMITIDKTLTIGLLEGYTSDSNDAVPFGMYI